MVAWLGTKEKGKKPQNATTCPAAAPKMAKAAKGPEGAELDNESDADLAGLFLGG